MDCPRCGTVTSGSPECPRCGVVLAKARRPSEPRQPRPTLSRALNAPSADASRSSLLLPLLGLAATVGAALLWLRTPEGSPPVRRSAEPSQVAAHAPDALLPPEILVSPPVPEAPVLGELPDDDGLTPEDAADTQRLVARLQGGGRIDGEDVRTAERLHALSPGNAAPLLTGVLVRAALQERAARDYSAAAGLLQRALAASPGSVPAQRVLLTVRVAQSDWPAVETVASEILRVSPEDGESVQALAYALVRQNRAAEGLELLQAFLDRLAREGRSDNTNVAALYRRIHAGLAVETPLRQHTLAHFHVRYDGNAHEEVGREVLRVLERHYATLATTFGRPPGGSIPVVLLSQRGYYDATGAPAWSGGQFSGFDAGVRIPIGGLSSSLTPELDGILMHELTHAFVHEGSAGLAPPELHEGLAQVMEGRRSSELGEETLRALAEGRIRGVGAAYLTALAFVEDLLAQRGQGGINDLLETMSRTRNADEAFRQVYGRPLRELWADWHARFRTRHAG